MQTPFLAARSLSLTTKLLIAGAVVSVLALLLVAQSIARATDAPSGYDVYATGLDMDPSDPAANTATTIGGGGADIDDGDIQSQTGNIAINGMTCIDVIIDSVPDGTQDNGQPYQGIGIVSFGTRVTWNGSIAGIVGYRAGDKNQGNVTSCNQVNGDGEDFLHSMGGDSAISQTNSLPNPTNVAPNTTGAFEIIQAWTDGSETGPGLLAQIAFRCLSTGSTDIEIDGPDVGSGITDRMNVAFDHNNGGGGSNPNVGGEYTTSTEFDGTLNCNVSPATPTPPPAIADIAVSGVSAGAPASANAGTPFAVTVNGTVSNNGPTTPVNTDVTVTLTMPADCSAAGGPTQNYNDQSIANGSPLTLPTSTFNVTCTAGGAHQFSGTVTALEDDVATDNVAGNNSGSANASTTITAQANMGIGTITLTPESTTPAAGLDFTFTADVALTNAGPGNPAEGTLQLTLVLPADCKARSVLTLSQAVSIPTSGTTATRSWVITCKAPTQHTLTVNASLTAGAGYSDPTPGNNSGSANSIIEVKTGVCGPDPAPAGSITQNLPPLLLIQIQNLTASGTTVDAAHSIQLNCSLLSDMHDQYNTPLNECPIGPLLSATRVPCGVSIDVTYDLVGGSPPGQPTVNLLPVPVFFMPPELTWSNDTQIPNGTTIGNADFSIRTDGGLGPNGFECTLDVNLPLTPGVEGGLQGNVPDSNSSADVINPLVWPNDLNAERALVEASLALPPLGTPTVTLHSRMVVPLFIAGVSLPLNVLTWEITNPIFAALTGSQYVTVAFPGDAVGPDAPGASGGNPDADDPPPSGMVTCSPHNVTLTWNATNPTPVISCDNQASTPMFWGIIDPDALNVSGDQGPRSDLGACVADGDNDGLSNNAEALYGTAANDNDTDNDGDLDGPDNCRLIPNADQANTDGDNFGNVCDNCPTAANSNQADGDTDAVGNACDNCPVTSNPGQADQDTDSVGNVCDNCPADANGDQADGDTDGPGDVCDNCPSIPNAGQENLDSDPFGDACDNCPSTASATQADTDDDGTDDACDTCPAVSNPTQADFDGDELGDICDNCPLNTNAAQTDSDADTAGDACDNCPAIPNSAQADADGDNYGDICDNCPSTPTFWLVGPNDVDCDYFDGVTETRVGTIVNAACSATSLRNDESGPDAWPVDTDDNQVSNTLDLIPFLPALGTLVGHPDYSTRLDFNGSGSINTLDLTAYAVLLNKTCAH